MKQELLSPEEFDAHVAAGTLRLAFVGMSNAGKSYRAKVLEREKGFARHRVDGEISAALELADEAALASWLGLPDSEGYAARERQYLDLEDKFTAEVATDVRGTNLVFDTTGSVVHLAPETIRLLHDNALVVHLDVGEESIDTLIERFFEKPKPVAWGEFFSQEPGESLDAALRRSYPLLLAERLKRYRALAHVNVPAERFREISGDETLVKIRAALGAGQRG